jgi:RNA polymerase sigma factor (sigma-70 family)
MNDQPTVFIVDDNPAIRKSLRWLIESVGLQVQTHESAQDFLDRYDPSRPGCVVLDVRMPGLSGLELQETLRERDIDIPIIIVTGYADVPMAVRAMRAGAVDFIEKPVSDQLLLDDIQRAIAQDAQNRQYSAEHRILNERISRLTPREHQVMQKVVDGLSSREIATEFSVSIKTVESHRAKIMKKMGATNAPHLIRMNLLWANATSG